jgi:serine/threonine protein kinase
MNLHHDGIVNAYGIYTVKSRGAAALGMILDYKQGGDFSCWIPTGGLPEWIARGIMIQLCDALVYLHGIPVVHKDIKPSNLLCERAGDGTVKVVLADFGFAAYVEDKKRVSEKCGTPGYIAPEMFCRDWSEQFMNEIDISEIIKIDVYSFGMILYASTMGENPFFSAYDTSGTQTFRRNARSLVPLAKMAGRSDELRSLLSGLCAKTPRRRLSISEARAHPWFFADGGVVPWTALEAAQ